MKFPQSVNTAVDLLRSTADQAALSLAARRKLATAIRVAIVPKGRPGRKPHDRLDKAFADYKGGLRGLELFRRHIPNFKKLSRWRRAVEQGRLRKNLEKRAQRERKKRQGEVTNPQTNCRPD